MDEWLEEDENMDIWIGNSDEKLTASKRRILITHWVGEAHERLQHPNYFGFLKNCFERTGCLMTSDGSEDHKIRPEGLTEYRVIPPLESAGPEESQEILVPEAKETSEDILTSTDIDLESTDFDEKDDLNLELDDEDNEKDRMYDVKLIGKKICALYEGSGWHTGTVL